MVSSKSRHSSRSASPRDTISVRQIVSVNNSRCSGGASTLSNHSRKSLLISLELEVVLTARSKTDSISTANSYASTKRAIMSAKRAARSISSGVKGGYGGSPGRFTNSSTPMVSFLVRKGVASSVTVLKPVFLSAWDQNDPSSLTSFTAIGCPLENTRPAIPFPGGQPMAVNDVSEEGSFWSQ